MNPEPGWYSDPAVAGQLRLWDGEGWTAQTRPFNPVPTSAPSPDPAHTARRRRMAVEGAGLGLMLLVMAAGVPALPSWGSPARPAVRTSKAAGSPGRAPAAPTGQPTPAAVTVDCRLAASRPSPARVIDWFGAHGLAATPSAAPALPRGACGVAGFSDAHAPGANMVVAYPDPQAADNAAATPPPPPAVAPLTFVQGIYVIALDPALTEQRPQYEAALVAYVAASNPAVVAPTTTTPKAVRSRSR
jgi:hypothetical protein